MKPKQIFICNAFCSLLLAASLQAQVPPLLNYQGKLSLNGAPASGMVTLIFSIYPSANGGASLWSETKNNVTFTNGLFNIQLGEVNGLPDSLFARYSELYLGIKIGTVNAPELTPRSQITSVAYARKANSANALDAPDGIPSKAVVVDNNGNVGIGTAVPAKLLHIKSSEATVGAHQVILEGQTAGYGAGISFQSTLNGSSTLKEMARMVADGENSWNNSDATTQDARLSFFTTLNGTTAERVRISSDGSVGIGATNPEAQLHIGTAGLGDAGVGFRMGSFGKFIIDSDNVVGGRFTVLRNGNVGIGTTNPTSRLHVKARGVRYEDHFILEGLDNGSNWNILVDSGLPGAFDNALRFKYESGQEALVLLTNGNVGIGTASPAEKLVVEGKILYRDIGPISSREFKENIAALSSQEATAVLQDINPVKFNYKDDEKKELHLGFIAEEVPDLVAMPNRQAISTMNIVAILTKAVQEQQKTIAELQSRVKSLEERRR